MEKKPWTVNDIVTILGAIFSGLALLITTWNSTKSDHIATTIGHVAQQQDVQLAKTEVIKAEVESTQQKAAVVEHKVQVIEASLPTKR